MTTLTLRKCECGIEFRIINARDGKSHILVCDCQHEIEILGSVTSIFWAKGGHYAGEQAWLRVPQERIKGPRSASEGSFSNA
jgi:hypothetical protein